jgi:hypothetical protein
VRVTALVYPDETGLLREHTHTGTALGYDFKVVFVTREEKTEKVTVILGGGGERERERERERESESERERERGSYMNMVLSRVRMVKKRKWQGFSS